MSTTINETLAHLGKNPETFRRDTPMIFRSLDKLQELERSLQDAIYDLEQIDKQED